jgi:hypothetical protein
MSIPATNTKIPHVNCKSTPTWADPGLACANDSLTIGLTCYDKGTGKASSGCTATTNVYADTAGTAQLTLAQGQTVVAQSGSAGIIATGTPSAAAKFGCDPSCLHPPPPPSVGVWVADWVAQ